MKIGELTEDVLASSSGEVETNDLGFSVQNISPALAEQFDAKPGDGVVVTEVKRGSLASMAGLEVGTVIHQVNRQKVPLRARHPTKLPIRPPRPRKMPLRLAITGPHADDFDLTEDMPAAHDLEMGKPLSAGLVFHPGLKAASLYHEIVYHPMEYSTVVESALHVILKVLRRHRGAVEIEFQGDCAVGSL